MPVSSVYLLYKEIPAELLAVARALNIAIHHISRVSCIPESDMNPLFFNTRTARNPRLSELSAEQAEKNS
jgi:hypothetical protein